MAIRDKILEVLKSYSSIIDFEESKEAMNLLMDLEKHLKRELRMESKMRGRPKGRNFEFIKSIKLNQKQIDNWDCKKVKAFLDNNDQLALIREMFEKGVIKVYKDKLTEKYKNFLEEL